MNDRDQHDWPDWLDEFRDEQPLQTPPAYFRHLSDEVMQVIRDDDAIGSSPSLMDRLLDRWAWPRIVVGGLSVLFIMSLVLWPETSSEGSHIEKYVLSNLEHFEEQTLLKIKDDSFYSEDEEVLTQLILEFEEVFLVEQIL